MTPQRPGVSASSRGPASSRLVWLTLSGGAALAWLLVWNEARGMGSMPGGMPLAATAFVADWTLMMAAMMLPATAPVTTAYSRAVGLQAHGAARAGRMAGLAVGYIGAWAGVGVFALLLDRGVVSLARDAPGAARWTVGVAVVGCGVYQLSPLKDRCLEHCRSPVGLLLHVGGYRGPLRDVRAGAYHAAYCIGCCWTLMVALVLLGAMNLVWMAVFASVITIEKASRYGPLAARLAGAALVLLGVLVLVHPHIAGILRPAMPAM